MIIRNIKELREALNKLEEEWTEKDREVLGEFEYQEICVDSFDSTGKYLGLQTKTKIVHSEDGVYMILTGA